MKHRWKKIVLVHVEYDKQKEIKGGELPIKLLEELAPSDYPVTVSPSSWINDGELYFQPYLRAKIEGVYKNVDIAIKMETATSSEIKSVKIQNSEIYYQKYKDDKNNIVYYIAPKIWEKNVYHHRPQETAVSHYNTIGKEIISMVFRDGHEETMSIFSKISDSDKDFHQALIFDLISIEQQLAIDRKSASSMSFEWIEEIQMDVEKLVEDFYHAFKMIESSPDRDLKPYFAKEFFHKTKKLTSQAVYEHEIFHKDKVNSILYQEDYDTFEHRVIKTQFFYLKSLVETRKKMVISSLKNQIARMEMSLGGGVENQERNIAKRIEEIEKKRKEANKQFESIVEQMKKPTDMFRLQRVRIGFRLNTGKERGGISVKGKALEINANVFGCYYNEYENDIMSQPKEYQVDQYKKTQYITISVPLEYEAACVLFDFFGYMNSDCLNYFLIIGKAKIKKEGLSSNYSRFNFCFHDIEIIEEYEFGNKTNLLKQDMKKFDYVEAKRKLKNYLMKIDFENYSEHIGFLKEKKETLECLKQVKKHLKEKESYKDWKKTEDVLNEIEQSELMKKTSSEKTSVKISNRFTFNPLYQAMYKIIISNKKRLIDISYDSFRQEDEFRVAKLPELYEIWCCIKILSHLIQDYGFTLLNINSDKEYSGVEGLREYIKNILCYDEFMSAEFCLKNDMIIEEKPIEITLWYNREIRVDRLKLENYFAKDRYGKLRRKSSLKPDIIMRITMEGKSKNFIFDAKYRDNTFADRVFYNSLKDIFEVAFQKYTLELENGNMDHEFDSVSGSFILHNCDKVKSLKNENNIQIYNSGHYLGARPSSIYEKFRKKIEDWEVSNEKFEDWCKRKRNIEKENKLGIITMNPNQNHFPYVMQMIMEHHFNLYQKVCWLCGSKELDILTCLTKGGYPKYHIKCRNKACNHFMVETHCFKPHKNVSKQKLGKHNKNYYGQGSKWNVYCPVCKNELSSYGNKRIQPILSKRKW